MSQPLCTPIRRHEREESKDKTLNGPPPPSRSMSPPIEDSQDNTPLQAARGAVRGSVAEEMRVEGEAIKQQTTEADKLRAEHRMHTINCIKTSLNRLAQSVSKDPVPDAFQTSKAQASYDSIVKNGNLDVVCEEFAEHSERLASMVKMITGARARLRWLQHEMRNVEEDIQKQGVTFAHVARANMISSTAGDINKGLAGLWNEYLHNKMVVFKLRDGIEQFRKGKMQQPASDTEEDEESSEDDE